MKPFRWDHKKNEQLKVARKVSFEAIVLAIESDGLLDILQHYNRGRYPNQLVMVVRIEPYAYLVPFVEESEYYFLKTIIPSRNATRNYLKNDDKDDDKKILD